jgi:hypothetical protein
MSYGTRKSKTRLEVEEKMYLRRGSRAAHGSLEQLEIMEEILT